MDGYLNRVLGCADLHAVEIVRSRIFGAADALRLRLIDRNYHVLDRISRRGIDGMTGPIRRRLEEYLVREGALRFQVFGGDECLASGYSWSPQDLLTFVDTRGAFKLGSGAYVCLLRDEGIALVNGFYPWQRRWLSQGPIVAFECRSIRPWTELRRAFIGAILPSRAELGSIRRVIYDEKNALGVAEFGISKNGVHISPGPLEALHQLWIYFGREGGPFSEFVPQTSFGAKLLSGGLTATDIERLVENPYLPELSDEQPVLDLTEDMDSADALVLLGMKAKRALTGIVP